MEREITWTDIDGVTSFTIYRDHIVKRTQFLGTIVDPISTETGLGLEYRRQYFRNPGEAFRDLDVRIGRL
jgi:hypothetical protein